jgi:hypothetical protein
MENLQYDEQNEEVVNPEQFQVGRAQEEEKHIQKIPVRSQSIDVLVVIVR